MSAVRLHHAGPHGDRVRGANVRSCGVPTADIGEERMRRMFGRQLYDVPVVVRGALVVLAIGIAAPAGAFKSRPMDYRVFRTENFEVYTADTRLEPVLGLVEAVLEDAHVRQTSLFDVRFEQRVPFFLFYGDEQFFQNTVVPVSEGTGGVTEAFKNRLLVPWTGSFKTFQHVVMHEFVHEVQFQVLYSGFWRTPRIAKSIFYPSWMMEGLAEYGARWLVRSTMETAVRDLAVDDALIPVEHLHNFAHLKPRQVMPAYEQSAMFMEYLATEYGENRLLDILKSFREKFDAHSVLMPVLNAPLRELDRKFREEMVQRYRYEVAVASMTDPDPMERVSRSAAFAVHHDAVCLWRDTALYIGDPDGRPAIYAASAVSRTGERGRPRVLISPGRLSRRVDVLHRDRMTVSRDGVLCFTGIKDNRSWVFLYDIPNAAWERIAVPGVDNVAAAAIAPAGDLIVVAGVTGGGTDLHLIHRRDGYLRRLTGDAAHEMDPVFSPDGALIAYVREVPCVKRDPVTGEDIRTAQTDLFLSVVSGGGEHRLTDTPGDERWPCFVSTDTLVYVSDHHAGYAASLSGVRNLWTVRTDGAHAQRITNVIGGVSHPAAADMVLAYVYYRKTEQHVYATRWNPPSTPHGAVGVSASEQSSPQSVAVSTLGGEPERSFQPVSPITHSPLPVSAGISTDLFFPFLMYTTGGGLSALLYWQASDMVGENYVTLYTNVFGTSNIAYTLTCENQRFRPVLFAGAAGQHFDDPFLRLRVDEDQFQAGVRYPLNTAAQLQVLFGYPYRRLTSQDTGASWFRSENVVLAAYQYSDVSGAYLEPLRGSYHQLSCQVSGAYIDGDYSYELYRYTGGTHLHLGWQHVLSLRLAGIVSRGRDAPVFALGGQSAVRGAEQLRWSGRALATGSVAYRMPVFPDINYYVWFLFPDFFFKSMYATAFADAGVDAEDTSRALVSVGAGIRVHTFVLQMMPLVFDLSIARVQGRGDLGTVTYFTLSGGW